MALIKHATAIHVCEKEAYRYIAVKMYRQYKLRFYQMPFIAILLQQSLFRFRYETVHSIKVTQGRNSESAQHNVDVWSRIESLERVVADVTQRARSSQEHASGRLGRMIQSVGDDSSRKVSDLEEKLRVSREQSLRKVAELEGKVRTSREQSQKEVNVLRGKLSSSNGEVQQLKQKLRASNDGVNALRQELGKLGQQMREQLSQLKRKMEASDGRTNTALSTIRTTIADSTSRMDDLKEQVENSEESIDEIRPGKVVVVRVPDQTCPLSRRYIIDI